VTSEIVASQNRQTQVSQGRERRSSGSPATNVIVEQPKSPQGNLEGFRAVCPHFSGARQPPFRPVTGAGPSLTARLPRHLPSGQGSSEESRLARPVSAQRDEALRTPHAGCRRPV